MPRCVGRAGQTVAQRNGAGGKQLLQLTRGVPQKFFLVGITHKERKAKKNKTLSSLEPGPGVSIIYRYPRYCTLTDFETSRNFHNHSPQVAAQDAGLHTTYCTTVNYNQLSTIEISTVRPSMRRIPYSMDVLEWGNEAHLRPWPKH